MTEDLIKKVQDILDTNNADHEEVWQDPNLPCVFYITIDGDWKHSHGYVDYLMKISGYGKMGEKNVEEDGDDWYKSTHVYIATARNL